MLDVTNTLLPCKSQADFTAVHAEGWKDPGLALERSKDNATGQKRQACRAQMEVRAKGKILSCVH